MQEELDELREATTAEEQAEELGDVLFVLARLGSWFDLDVEDSLRLANRKFRKRFCHMETAIQNMDMRLQAISAAQWDRLWTEAKKKS